MALNLDVKPGDTIRIGERTVIRIERKSGQRKHENPWHDLLLLDDDRNPFCQN